MSTLKLPVCLMPQGSAPTRHASVAQAGPASAASPASQLAQQTQVSVSKTNPGYCCLATSTPPRQPGLIGPAALPLPPLPLPAAAWGASTHSSCPARHRPALHRHQHQHPACPWDSGDVAFLCKLGFRVNW